MTSTTPSPYDDIPTPPSDRDAFPDAVAARGGDRLLAGALTTYLGGYLVVLAATGQLSNVVANLAGGRVPLPGDASFVVLTVLQFLFALAVVVVGILLPRGAAGPRIAGAAIAVVGTVVVLLLSAARVAGLVRVPLRDLALAVNILTNPWFLFVLVLGIAWLVSRSARLGWLALLGTLLIAPIWPLLPYTGLSGAIATVLTLAVAGVVGAVIVLAGARSRP